MVLLPVRILPHNSSGREIKKTEGLRKQQRLNLYE